MTLIACLPNESKKFLLKNGITISTQTPLFSYVTFIKSLSINEIIKKILQLDTLQNLDIIITREIFLNFYSNPSMNYNIFHLSLILEQ